MCVKHKFTHPRITVGAISESRRIGGKRRVGNRNSLLQEVFVCVKRKRTHPRIAVGAISESRRIGGKRRVGNRNSLLQRRLRVSSVNLRAHELR